MDNAESSGLASCDLSRCGNRRSRRGRLSEQHSVSLGVAMSTLLGSLGGAFSRVLNVGRLRRPRGSCSFRGRKGWGEARRLLGCGVLFPGQAASGRCWMPAPGAKACFQLSTLQNRVGDGALVYAGKTVVTAFHRGRSCQISTSPTLAAAFVLFSLHSPSNHAVIITLVITSLGIWCEKLWERIIKGASR